MIKELRSILRPFTKYIRRRLNKGDNVYCVICGQSFKSFAPHGKPESYRLNARCPNCDSLERHRLFWKYLTEKTNYKQWRNVNVLHFAPEKVLHKIFSSLPNVNYVPCDLSPERYDFSCGVKTKRVDITSIPFDDNYFDVIICSHVLEHIPDDRLAMKELQRVMKPDGWGIFQVPIDYSRKETYEDFTITTPEARRKAFGQWDHVRCYGADYKGRLAEAGFAVTEDDYVKTFNKKDLERYRLTDNELIYYCRKKV
jgi:SAM-dependent methyltransferase